MNEQSIPSSYNRKIGIDILKFISAFFVVCIHIPFKGEFGKYFTAISRFAVPIFFIISGFFYQQTVKKGNENKQIIKILKLCIIANFIYLVYRIIMLTLNDDNILSWLQKTFSFKNFLEFIFLNESPLAVHLWYLNAFLYVLIIMKFINKYNKYKLLYFITPLLLIFDLILGKYSLLFFQQNIPYLYVRNFLFVGLPYFAIGIYINNIMNKYPLNIRVSKIRNLLIIFIVLFCVTTILERFILVQFGINAKRDHYISTTFLAISLFLYFVGITNKNKNRFINYIAELGKNYSTNIYIFHYMIIGIFNKLFNDSIIYDYLGPIIVFISTLILCIIFKSIFNFMKRSVLKKE